MSISQNLKPFEANLNINYFANACTYMCDHCNTKIDNE